MTYQYGQGFEKDLKSLAELIKKEYDSTDFDPAFVKQEITKILKYNTTKIEIYSNAEKWFDNYLNDSDRELLHKELDLKIAFPAHFDDLLTEDQAKVKQSLLKEKLENCSNCKGKGWYLGDTNPEIDNDYGEIECEKCNGTGVKEE